MSALALFWALTSSIGWAGFDATRKRLTSTLEPIPLTLLIMLGQLPFFLVWGISSDLGAAVNWSGYWLPALVSIVLNTAANVMFVWAVKLSPLSVTIPMLSLSPVFAAIVGIPILGDVPGVPQWIGISIVVAGALLLQVGGDGEVTDFVSKMKSEPGVPLMAGVSLLWAISGTADSAATQHAPQSLHGFVLCAGIAIFLLAWLIGRSRLGEVAPVKGALGTYAACAAFGALALGTQLVAFGQTLVSFVEAIKRAVGMLLALVLGRVLFKEEIRPGQIFAVLLMSAGVALIVLDPELLRGWFGL
ncbi:MAG: drug/metabolite transporter (DMT)-like permease [Flavobacteriales bacterium]